MELNAATILDAGAASSEIRYPTGDTKGATPFVVVPEDYRVHDIESLLVAPTRKRGSVVTTDSTSFIYYTKKHGSLDDCTIYAEINSEQSVFNLVAVINDHGADAAQWRDHRCTFKPKQSVEWARWLGKNKAVMSQADFATWLEDNLPDIATVPGMPTGAEVLTMALGFEATSDKRVKSRINLQNGGVQFEFVEDETKDTRITMKVFERFTIGVPVFDGSSDAYPIEARLKYREKDGKVNFWFELIRPDRVFKTAVTEQLECIKGETGFPIISGKPE